jgi:hypothetical protein
MLFAAPAHAGPGGSIAMPGPCDYPGVGHQTYAAGAGWWYCDFPVEENGSHWHVEGKVFNAGGPTGSGEYGFDFAGFGINVPGGVLGGGDGWQGYLWPDNMPAPWPNPPGAWKNRFTPKLPPPEHRGPPAPSPDPNPVGDPNPPPFTGAVTNPDNPNPDATQNPPS